MLVYPKDETTDFLKGIPDFLFNLHGEESFIYQRLGFSVKEHRECIEAIERLSHNSLVVFLGHGRSDALLGAMDYERFDFVTQDKLHIFQQKKVFFLSCRSSELLQDQGIEGIGFGHLLSSPSELNDINLQSTYRYLYAYHGVPDSSSITTFNDYLVRIVCSSLNDYIVQDLTLEGLYLNLKLRLNKAIADLIQNNSPVSVQNTVNLLLKAKMEMRLFKFKIP